ncbi:hypothetical protein GCM10010247_31140 [Streptomyces calvus]|nr:hypothetical protein GCM10010247_31140 [Streptomyces calvus]
MREGKRTLLATKPSGRALHAWMLRFADWAGERRGVCEVSVAMKVCGCLGAGPVCDGVRQVLAMVFEAGATAGELCSGMDWLGWAVSSPGLEVFGAGVGVVPGAGWGSCVCGVRQSALLAVLPWCLTGEEGVWPVLWCQAAMDGLADGPHRMVDTSYRGCGVGCSDS